MGFEVNLGLVFNVFTVVSHRIWLGFYGFLIHFVNFTFQEMHLNSHRES
jgi:hypothetical protein